MNTLPMPLKIDTAAVSFRSGGFQTRLPSGRESVSRFHPLMWLSQGHSDFGV